MATTALIVAIDGPSGVGKSTLAAALARRLGLRHVDTGAYYRAATLAALKAGFDAEDPALAEAVARARIERRDGRTLLDGVDVEDEIRRPSVTSRVSAVARHPRVRALLVERQRAEVGDQGAVVDGRDAGTVVVPDADLKVWLTVMPIVRARRRIGQFKPLPTTIDEQATALAYRDMLDAAQMEKAADAVHVDGTDKSVEQLVDELLGLLEERTGARRVEDRS